MLAAKFLAKRNVNVDAIAKIFRPLWRTTPNFCIREAGDNHLLFVFELERNVDMVLNGEPWSFDKHLVILKKYDGMAPMEEIN